MGAMTWTLLWGLVAAGILTAGYFWLRPKDATATESKKAVKRMEKRVKLGALRDKLK